MKLTKKILATALASAAKGKDKKTIDALADRVVRYFVQRGNLRMVRSVLGELARLDHAEMPTIQVTLAHSDEHAEKTLRKELERSYGTAAIAIQYDPSLIGGMILTVGDRRIDTSIRRRFQKLRETLRS